ncbi:MAG: class F sortase, partial [Demequina sp.]|nr:class F sortase [Demequina sp.]
MGASDPVRLIADSIAVDTPLMALGLQPDGTLEVPPDGTLAGWFTGAPTPGELGPAVIAGHVDWNGPAIFHDLHLMVPGDLVNVERANGSTAVFAVTEVGQYPKNEFPTDAVYGAVDFAGLRLITCGGLFDDEAGHYEDNVVVFAELVSSTPATSG